MFWARRWQGAWYTIVSGTSVNLTAYNNTTPRQNLFDQTDFNNIYRDLERVYLVTLAKDTENPLGPRSDEVGKKKEKDKDKPDDKDKHDRN